MEHYALQLYTGDDLLLKLRSFAKENDIQFGWIVTAVGGVDIVKIRMANATPDNQDIRTLEGGFEKIGR